MNASKPKAIRCMQPSCTWASGPGRSYTEGIRTMEAYMEQAKSLHLIIAILSFYLFLIFSWWWLKQRGATTIYGVTCFLMFGLFVSHTGAWWIYAKIQSGHELQDIIDIYMSGRHYFTLVPLTLYAIHVTKRACFSKRLLYGRRKDDA